VKALATSGRIVQSPEASGVIMRSLSDLFIAVNLLKCERNLSFPV